MSEKRTLILENVRGLPPEKTRIAKLRGLGEERSGKSSKEKPATGEAGRVYSEVADYAQASILR